MFITASNGTVVNLANVQTAELLDGGNHWRLTFAGGGEWSGRIVDLDEKMGKLTARQISLPLGAVMVMVGDDGELLECEPALALLVTDSGPIAALSTSGETPLCGRSGWGVRVGALVCDYDGAFEPADWLARRAKRSATNKAHPVRISYAHGAPYKEVLI
jgi:hypothetical protein